MPDDANPLPGPDVLARYNEDAALWATQQAALLRAGRWEALDIENLVDEIECLAQTEMRLLEEALRAVLLHMLLWDHSPDHRTRTTSLRISIARSEANRQLKDNPSLRRRLPDAVADAYPFARRDASSAMDAPLRTFPEARPYTVEDIFGRPHGDEED